MTICFETSRPSFHPLAARPGVSPILSAAGGCETAEQDGSLLALCAEFEATARRHNGLWCWRVWGEDGVLKGANYVEDDDERDVASTPLTERMNALVEQMCDHPPVSLAGMRALARCVLFSAADVRDVVAGVNPKPDLSMIDLSRSEIAMVAILLCGLTHGKLTDAECMEGPAQFVADTILAGLGRVAAPGRAGTVDVLNGDQGQATSHTASSDTDLIAACAEFEQLEERIGGIYSDQISDLEAKRQAQPLEARENELLALMALMQATTPAGIHARARVLAAHNSGGEFSFDPPATVSGQLLGNLMRDAAALGGAA